MEENGKQPGDGPQPMDVSLSGIEDAMATGEGEAGEACALHAYLLMSLLLMLLLRVIYARTNCVFGFCLPLQHIGFLVCHYFSPAICGPNFQNNGQRFVARVECSWTGWIAARYESMRRCKYALRGNGSLVSANTGQKLNLIPRSIEALAPQHLTESIVYETSRKRRPASSLTWTPLP